MGRENAQKLVDNFRFSALVVVLVNDQPHEQAANTANSIMRPSMLLSHIHMILLLYVGAPALILDSHGLPLGMLFRT